MSQSPVCELTAVELFHVKRGNSNIVSSNIPQTDTKKGSGKVKIVTEKLN